MKEATMAIQDWLQAQQVAPISWTCGHCGLSVGGNMGYYRNPAQPARLHQPPLQPHEIGPAYFRILICPNCDKPTFFDDKKQMPGVAFGSDVEHLPSQVATLYAEARNCMSVSAFTASVLATRKLLMNIAVTQGAPENDNFLNYVKFLADKGYVPPNATNWVDHIRKKGNEATHEIPAIQEPDAKDLLTFMEMILKLVFEYPNRVPKPSPTGAGS
jgi:hypothetical protein